MPINNIRAGVRGQGSGVKAKALYLLLAVHCLLFTVIDANGMENQNINVVVTKKLIKKGQEIKAGDIGLEEKTFLRIPGDVIQDIGAVIHKTAKRGMQAGVIIRSNMLESKKMVKRGDPVTIVAESGSLTIKTVGQAVEDGSEGKFIKVLNLSSRKIIVGRVVAGSTVSVQF